VSEDRANVFLRMIRRAQRGRLKVYLGYCAGVGKTYQMLQEGHRIHQQGIDVVIGLVETHGRVDIANIAKGLEIVPRRKQEYHGVIVEEMDLDGVLARKPQVVLVDELAHTNVPGSRNPKRYQDVQDVLAAGIHVITTLNVQHMESLYDTVERATGVKVRERLPDTVLAEADQIVNVDLTTEDLQRRLKEGKIYPMDRVGTALNHFFQTRNLEELRELTLRELASQIDLRRRETPPEENPASPDQVLVCLSSRGPNSETLLRYASRLAGKLNRNWYAVYVQTPSEEPTMIDAHTQRLLAGTLTLAKQLGAMVFTYKGEDVADTILRFAREYRVGHIVLGSSRPVPFWKRVLGRKDILDRLIKGARGVTIVVLDTRRTPEPSVNGAREAVPVPSSPPEQPKAPEMALSLSALLSPGRIIIWDGPVSRGQVLDGLVRAAATGWDTDQIHRAMEAIHHRESQGSTFLNEGVALPHARVPGLPSPRVSMGLCRAGVVDVPTENPVQLVFLILSPEERPEAQLQLLAAAARASQSRHLLAELLSCRGPGDVLSAIHRWESEQAPPSLDS
jgi:two-component system, OmpR family, sensor histidine kinase KdpD